MAGGTALEIWLGWCRLESTIVGVMQSILWSQGTVSKCHLCPWLSLHTWHYITQQSGLQSGPAQWRGVGGAPWGVNSCPGNATFQHQLLMCKACCSGLARSRAWENSCILYETETNLLSTEQQQRVIPPTSPTPLLPKCCGPLCEGLEVCASGCFANKNTTKQQQQKNRFQSKAEFSMSWERNELSVECLKHNFTVYSYSLGQANVWEVNTWTRGTPADLASWSNYISLSVLLSLFCTARLLLWKAALQHRIVAPRTPVHAGDALLIDSKVLSLDATTSLLWEKSKTKEGKMALKTASDRKV